MASPSSDPAAGGKADWGALPRAGSAGAPQHATNLVEAFVGGDGRVDALERYGTLAARILISQIFLLSGVMKVMDPAGTAEQMAGLGMFWIPFFLWSAVAVELGGGLSLLLGYKAR